MPRLAAAIDALTSQTDAQTTLIAFTTTTRIDYPDAAQSELDRDQRKQLRRLERAARAALRQPPPSSYSVLAGPAWHLLLAPHAATERVYLARAQRQHHYQPDGTPPAPMHPPGTLLAIWSPSARHAFTHVTTPEAQSLLMHYSTAQRHIYLPPITPQTGIALAFKATPTVAP